MAKLLLVDPKEVRRGGVLSLGDIPVNAYAKTLAEELAGNPAITRERCVRAYRDMALIREFESMLDGIKKFAEYEGLKYAHAGPAH
ncbi:MAG: dehydrogenase, partial [Candidatus Hydrogenedentota bacterium]